MDRRSDYKRVESGGGLLQRLIRRQVAEDASSVANNVATSSNGRLSLDTSLEEVASGDVVKEGAITELVEYVRDDSSLLSLQPWIYKNGISQGDGERIPRDNYISDRCRQDLSGVQLSPGNVTLCYGFDRNQRVLRNRRRRRSPVKPVTLENCLIPSLYKEHFEIGDQVHSSLTLSTTPTIRPFFITDGNTVISKSSFDPLPCENGLQREISGIKAGAMAAVIGVPPLPKWRKSKRKSPDLQRGEPQAFHMQTSQKLLLSQGSPDAMLLFFLGISIGAMSAVLSNRKEVEKLSNMLEHTENLVQDLQEELEMKNSLTVNELPDESFESQEIVENFTLISDSIDSFQNQLPRLQLSAREPANCSAAHLPKSVHKSKSLSNIEAELEAELEKLELNMSATKHGEIDPELDAELVHGDLRADTLGQAAGDSFANPHTDRSSKSRTQTPDANYSVSPRELSLCLHKVIQSRLEERIKELERALSQSQKQVKFLESESQKQVKFVESERAVSHTSFSTSYMDSSSNQASPISMDQDINVSGAPLCIKLSGDALTAYQEAYEEFMRMAREDEEDPVKTADLSGEEQGDHLFASNRSLIWGMEGGAANKLSHKNGEQVLRSSRSNDSCESNENDEDEIDDDDGEGELLIQKIVERTRKGSPALMHVQRMLFSMDK